MAQALLAAGADASRGRSHSGNTPAHFAAARGRTAVLAELQQTLRRSGVDLLSLRNGQGDSLILQVRQNRTAGAVATAVNRKAMHTRMDR